MIVKSLTKLSKGCERGYKLTKLDAKGDRTTDSDEIQRLKGHTLKSVLHQIGKI